MANKLTTYINGSIEEMKKVTWPSHKETKNFTLLVIGISVSVAVFLGALDFVFAYALELLLSK